MGIVPTEQERATSDGLMGQLADLLGLSNGLPTSAPPVPAIAPVQVAQGTAYNHGLGAFAFGDALSQGYDGAIARKIAEGQAQAEARRQQQLAQAKAAYVANPNAKTFGVLAALDPRNAEAIERGFKALDVDQQKVELRQASEVRGYLAAKQPERAARALERRIAADKAAGQDTSGDEEMLSLIREAPDEALPAVDYWLSSAMGPEKWEGAFKAIGEGRVAEAKLPGEVAQAAADADLKAAQARKAAVEAAEIPLEGESQRQYRAAARQRLIEQSAIEWGRLKLDTDRAAQDVALKLDELDQKRSGPVALSATSEKAMTEAVGASTAAQQLSTRAATLAAGLKATDAAGGWIAAVSEGAKGALGGQNALSVIRRDIQSVLNSQALTLLPPGPASDKDIAIIKSGMPQPTWKKERVVEYLEALARTQARVGDVEQARADWISENGNIGRASRDLTVNGRQVAKGSNFSDFARSTQTASTPAPAASAILDRYGR